MNFILLISLKDQTNQEWSLVDEIRGAVQRNDLKPLQSVGVIPIGRDAILFDQNVAHNSLVRVCAHLIAQHEWPYLVLPVEASSILVEGTCKPELQAILDKS